MSRTSLAIVLLVFGFTAGAVYSQVDPSNRDGASDAVAERLELTPPKEYKLYGGADIESRVDAEGRIFVAATGETPRGFGGLMWMQEKTPDGEWKSTPIDLGGLYPGGRGSLSVERDGKLYLTLWAKESSAWRLQIRQWKP